MVYGRKKGNCFPCEIVLKVLRSQKVELSSLAQFLLNEWLEMILIQNDTNVSLMQLDPGTLQ